jgi:CubicO group peptidase (beta-lactamase class C family)
VLRLAEDGKVSIDEDVNLKLKSWRVPDSQYTKEQKVTIRRILSHTAGTTVHGFLGYPPGAPIPTLPQILNGEPPANNPPIRVDYVPSTKQRYSGGGFTVLQQLMIDVTSKPYPRIMQDLVFDKLGLKDSTFEQPLKPSRDNAAASGRNENGEFLPGKWTVQPEMACCGLWTTPSDLGRIGIEVTLSKSGKSNRVLSAGMTREMLRPQTDDKLDSDLGPNARMGLGWFLGDPSDPGRFEHSGVNTGFSVEFVMWDSGQGVVVMVNNWSFASKCLMRYLINNIAKEYGWKYRVTPYTPWPYADTVILATARLRGPQAAIARYFELKKQWAEQKERGAQTVFWPSDPPDYPPSEWDLFGVANVIADSTHLKDAIEILKVEVQEYPKWVPAYRTLGELYARAGDSVLAIQNYEKLLQLQPDDRAAKAALKKLTESRQLR